jgi:hypothetical protein
VQCRDGRRSCNQPQRSAENREARRRDAGRFGGSLNNRWQETGGERVIETLGRQADRALLAVGMVLDIELVQHQAELADDQCNDEQQPAEPVRHIAANCESVDHNRRGYPESCSNGNGFLAHTACLTDLRR